MSSLHALAEAAGLAVRWHDYRQREQLVDDDVLRGILEALDLPCATPAQIADSLDAVREEAAAGAVPLLTAHAGEPLSLPPSYARGGRHRLLLESGDALDLPCAPGAPLPAVSEPGYHTLLLADGRTLTLAVAPALHGERGGLAPGRRAWGISAQVYALRRDGDGGIGDFGAVAQLARAARRHGADAIAISPVHALFGALPQRYGPYAPSSRLMLNPLYADPSAVFGSEAVRAALAHTHLDEVFAELQALPLVDWERAAVAKSALFADLYRRLIAGPDSALQRELRTYCAVADAALREHATFEVLHRHFLARPDALGDWRRWPQAFRDPRSAEVAAFAAAHAHEIDHQLFLQWLAGRSLDAAQRAAREAGMAIGLIGDLAVGTDAAGSHAWSRQRDMLIGVEVGAPPDDLGPAGQNWGLTTFSPRALRASGYAAFIELLRANLRYTGGLRIDHVLGFARLWLIPQGARPGQGAYLRSPMQDLLRLTALEAWRHGALIVGEDLGTIPEGFRQQLDEAGILGMRVLWFERDPTGFFAPQHWTPKAVGTTSTHDAPTVAGWWAGRDLDWRARLGLFGADADEPGARAERARDRERLWSAFTHAGVAEGPLPQDGGEVAVAAAAYVGRSACALAVLPVEDALALEEQANIPGTIDEHPNWRRRMPAAAETMLEEPAAAACVRALAALRSG